MKRFLSIVLTLSLCLCLAACTPSLQKDDLWESATYKEDTVFGEGKKDIEVKFTLSDKSITLKIRTDCDTLAEALFEHKLISGEKGPYGIYVKTVNGIVADYSKDKSYWAFYKDGKYMNTGADNEKIKDGGKYEIAYTK